MPSTLLDAKTLCANNADVGMNLSDPRLVARINEAQRRLVRHYNFIVRREEYDAAPKTWVALDDDSDNLIVDDLDATKLIVLALWREENNSTDLAQPLETRALNFVEQSIITAQEAAQKATWQAALGNYAVNTFGHYKARLGLECPDIGLRWSDTRAGRLVNEAQRRLILHYNFVVRREEYDETPKTWANLSVSNSDVRLDNFDATKLMAIAIWREQTGTSTPPDPNGVNVKAAHEQQALDLVEKAIVADQEATQKATWQAALGTYAVNTFGHYKARLGLECPDIGLRWSDTRVGRLVNEAQRRLILHYNFVVRREEYDETPVTWANLSVSNSDVRLDNFDATKLMAIAIWREQTGTSTPPDPNGANVKAAHEQQALDLVEKAIIADQEATQKATWQAALGNYAVNTFGHYKARLGLECPDIGLRWSDTRIGRLVNEAQRRLILHYNFVVRREEYDETPVTWANLSVSNSDVRLDNFDATKLMAIAIWREQTGTSTPPDPNGVNVKAAHEQQALDLVEKAVVAAQEAAQKSAWQTQLSANDAGTFGHVKARIGLELADLALRYSDSRLGRFVNAAEEALMMKTKAVGTVAEYKIDVEEDGNILLPLEIEAVLFAAMQDIPAPVYRQAYEWIENGPGYQTTTGPGWGSVLVARGEDATTGKRKFFVRNPAPDECVRLLCKKRFTPHTVNSSKMTVRNTLAIREMVMSLALATPDPERAQMHETRALLLIEQELQEFRGGEQGQARFNMRGAGKRMPRVR